MIGGWESFYDTCFLKGGYHINEGFTEYACFKFFSTPVLMGSQEPESLTANIAGVIIISSCSEVGIKQIVIYEFVVILYKKICKIVLLF